MMRHDNRRSATKVVAGRVRTKNNWILSTDYYDAPEPSTVLVDRKRPGEGYKHILRKSDIYRFIELLPDWKNLAVGLNAVVLAPGSSTTDGYYVPGVVHVCAWEAGMWRAYPFWYYEEHRDIFARLGVACTETADGYFECRFDEDAVRGYQLLHVLLHELGHHHDRMTTRTRKESSRGEKYAEGYARAHAVSIWEAYQKAFGL